jgi:hypothetical protein
MFGMFQARFVSMALHHQPLLAAAARTIIIRSSGTFLRRAAGKKPGEIDVLRHSNLPTLRASWILLHRDITIDMLDW